ncbi:MAG: SH3 domain-containing protein [Flavobacterium sp.]
MKKTLLTFGLLLITILTFGQQTKYVDTEELNIRAGAGTKYEVVEKISQGQKVTVLTEHGKWSEIELENGTKGFVSTKFLSDTETSSSPKSSDKKNSWIGYVLVIGFVLYGLKKLFGSSSSNSSSQRNASTNRQDVRRKSGNSAVYRFRIKGSGSAGGFQYADGMNVEVAVKGLGANGSPFNNIVEKLFVQEIARKYNVEPRFHSGIKMMFKRDKLDVEIM